MPHVLQITSTNNSPGLRLALYFVYIYLYIYIYVLLVANLRFVGVVENAKML
jgi:hypothetical protein